LWTTRTRQDKTAGLNNLPLPTLVWKGCPLILRCFIHQVLSRSLFIILNLPDFGLLTSKACMIPRAKPGFVFRGAGGGFGGRAFSLAYVAVREFSTGGLNQAPALKGRGEIPCTKARCTEGLGPGPSLRQGYTRAKAGQGYPPRPQADLGPQGVFD